MQITRILFSLALLIVLTYSLKPAQGQNDSTNKTSQGNAQVSPTEKSVNQSDIKVEHSPIQKSESDNEKTKAVTRAEKIQIGINVFLALLVLGQLLIYRQQRNITWRAERAYVGIDQMQFIEPLAVGIAPSIRVIFRNGGRTPAWGFATRARLVNSQKTIDEVVREYPVGAATGRLSFLPANTPKRVEFPMGEFEVTPERFTFITSGVTYLYVIGEAHFTDFRRKRQVFPFRAVYDPHSRDFQDAD